MATESEPNNTASKATPIGVLSLQGGGSVNLVIIGERLGGGGDTVDWFSFNHFPSLETVQVSVDPLILFSSRLNEAGVNGETQMVRISPRTGVSGPELGYIIKAGYDAYKNELNALVAEIDRIKAAMQQKMNSGTSDPGFWAEVTMYNQLTAFAGEILELNGSNTDPEALADDIRGYLDREPNRGGGFDTQLDSVYRRMASLFDNWERPKVYDLSNRPVTALTISQSWSATSENKSFFEVTGSHKLSHFQGTQVGTTTRSVEFGVSNIKILATLDGNYAYVAGTSGADKKTLSSRNETMDAGNGNDSIDSAGGNDSVSGGAGNDTLKGGIGNDTLTGGTGLDSLDGGTGNDTFVIASENDKISDSGGTDTLVTTSNRSLAGYSTIENLVLAGTASINGAGNGLSNKITGNAGNNQLTGGAGKDTLNGGAGNDTYHLSNETDTTIIDSAGFDTITSTVTRSLKTYTMIERLTLLGTANISAVGNDHANELRGNSGNNTLDGGLGADTLWGGLGNDTYILGWNDVIIDTGGSDRVLTPIDLSLADFDGIEHLSLLLGANLGIGNDANNSINGNIENDTLVGDAGSDTLLGSGGDDRIYGDGTNESHFKLGSGTAQQWVTIDTIFGAGPGDPPTILLDSEYSYDPNSNIEDSVLARHVSVTRSGQGGSHAYAVFLEEGETVLFDIDGTSAFDTMIALYASYGLVAANNNEAGDAGSTRSTDSKLMFTATQSGMYVLNVGTNNGTVYGTGAVSSAHSYTLHTSVYGIGPDTLIVDPSSGASDTLVGGIGDDFLDGGRGDDRIVGGAGADVQYGGTGHDLFVFDSASDSAVGTPDTIVDFRRGWDGDRIDLSKVSAATLSFNSTSLHSSSPLVFTTTNEVRYIVHGSGALGLVVNLDGDLNDAEMEIVLSGMPSIDLYSWDFIL